MPVMPVAKQYPNLAKDKDAFLSPSSEGCLSLTESQPEVTWEGTGRLGLQASGAAGHESVLQSMESTRHCVARDCN